MRLLVIDGNSIVNRAFYGIKLLSTKDGRYTNAIYGFLITLEKLIELMSINPRKRFGLNLNDDVCVFDLESEYIVDPKDFLSMGKFTPFEGHKLNGVNKLTVCNGKIVYKNV